MTNEYSLRVNSVTEYNLGINYIIILESALEKVEIEYDSREGYIEHLNENLPQSLSELNAVENIEEDIILIKRDSNGVQKVITPDTEEYNDLCEELIKLSL